MFFKKKKLYNITFKHCYIHKHIIEATTAQKAVRILLKKYKTAGVSDIEIIDVEEIKEYWA